MAIPATEIYSATYSNVPVYEFNIEGNHVMRRRKDDYVNATHILKVADYDKPARTRILEREVQKGIHEKIQGGYGKYQGTWIPLSDAVLLAKRNNVYDRLRPIFDYVASNVSPPPAPKHSTNQSKPRVPKQAAVKKASRVSNAHLMSDDYENMSNTYRDDDSQDNETMETSSFLEGDDGYGSQYVPGSRKRKRGMELADQQHTVFADALLDYFILSSTEAQSSQPPSPPQIPPSFEINRPIDDQGHTALHWAVAMGDLDLVKLLIDRGAGINVRNKRGETPLIRAVVFTNNFEKNTMQSVVDFLRESITQTDMFNASVLHHIVMTTNSRLRRKSAQHYLNVLLENLGSLLPHEEFDRFLNLQDRSAGDTALHIAARHDAKRCVKILQRHGAHSDAINRAGETADQLCTSLQAIHQELCSSSPPPMDLDLTNGTDGIAALKSGSLTHFRAETARSFSQSFDGLAQEKSLQVALAIENDFKDRSAALTEAQQALEKLEQEIENTQQEALKYSSQDSSNDTEEFALLEAEHDALVKQGQAYSEQQQHRELHASIRDAERQLPPEAHKEPPLAELTDADLEERVQAGLELATEQHKRRQLTRDVVEAKALAGMSAHGEALKRLVAETTGTNIEDVSALAPELLDALQEAKADFAPAIPLVV